MSEIDLSKNLFGRLTFRFKSAFGKSKSNKKSSEDEPSTLLSDGKIFRLWSWTLPLLLGLTTGWFGMTCFEVWLDGQNGSNRLVATVSSLAASVQETDADNLAAFLRVNPFNIAPIVIPEPVVSEDEVPVKVVGSLASAVLKGTSPGYVAWMEDQGKLRLIMIGDSFDVYTLEEVTYLNATFVKDDDRVVKEIIYGRDNSLVASKPVRSLPEVKAAAGQVVPSDPTIGTTGAINRDMVNDLLENPFEELRKVRIRPADAEQGLQVEWITKDSILSKLGVKENDVVQAVNGIVFRNAMDISNSLSSLMGSDQFVVELVRNGVPTTLQYEVR